MLFRSKNHYLVLSLGMGTSDQMTIGSPEFKRKVSLHHEDKEDEVVSISRDWKSKARVERDSYVDAETTHDRLFSPAKLTDRLPKLPLNHYRKFDIVTGVHFDDKMKSSLSKVIS